eukprot:m.226533 g.226533  ORF g.226533 m.226533 type:complete len:495 (-) comp11437_c0_seq1:71-1555(-)
MATASGIAYAFLKHYFEILNDKPQHLVTLFSSSASYTRHEEGSAEEITKGDTISERIESLNFKNCRVEIISVFTQSAPSDGIFIQVFGWLSNDNQTPRKFAQAFALAQAEQKRYHITNDMFTYLQEEAQPEHVQPVAVEAPAQPAQPAPASPVKQPASPAKASPSEPIIPLNHLAVEQAMTALTVSNPVIASAPVPAHPAVSPAPVPSAVPAVVEAEQPAAAAHAVEEKPSRRSNRGGRNRPGKQTAAIAEAPAAETAAAPSAPVAAASAAVSAPAPVAPAAAAPAVTVSPAKVAPPKNRNWADRARPTAAAAAAVVAAPTPVAAAAPTPAPPAAAPIPVPAPPAVAPVSAPASVPTANGVHNDKPARTPRDAPRISIYIPSIPKDTTPEAIKEAFAAFKPTGAFVHKSASKTSETHYAFADFADEASMEGALKLGSILIGGTSFPIERRKPQASLPVRGRAPSGSSAPATATAAPSARSGRSGRPRGNGAPSS